MAVKKSELYSMLFEACNKLRGGVEPARYKDYVLMLLFFKYVSDRYKGQPFAEYTVPDGASFDDLIALKGTSKIGEETDIIIQKFLEANGLQGALPDVSFNNHDELGNGKELVDKVSGLIGVFQNPAIDFKSNRASGDDIIGDAYEYFMMQFAQASGKSKGQFYTPSEVSRIIARLIGIGDIKSSQNKKWTLYDPAAGSGSLLIRAADEAPVDSRGNSIVSIYAQEKDNSTAGLAKMNFVLHQKGEGDIKRGSTLSDPQYKDHEQLKKFDFIVMNPPFSDKSWSDGVKPDDDKYGRFSDYGIPPLKNGDYAWFLHVLKSLNSTGRAGIILPHGVLFRGNAEEAIRKKIIDKRYIEGIISLPQNLFYGTGIPACILIIDKAGAEKREGVFLIDASRGFRKDGAKNRLREQDIEKIVRTYLAKEEVPGYSRLVAYKDVIEHNNGNLNISRYIQRPSNTLPQNIAAHLNGGIPGSDISTLSALWSISPKLKDEVFTPLDIQHGTYVLALPSEQIEETIRLDANVTHELEVECHELFDSWAQNAKPLLLNIDSKTDPKSLIRALSDSLLSDYKDALLVDAYDAYDCLLNYWNEKLQDDAYLIRASGYAAGRDIDYVYGKKKAKNKDGEEITIEDKTKVKSFDGTLIPRSILEEAFFSDELDKIESLTIESELLATELDALREEESGDDGLLKEALNEEDGSISKASVNTRIKELDEKRTSSEISIYQDLIRLFDKGDINAMEVILKSNPSIDNTPLRNKNGSFGKKKLKDALLEAIKNAPVPENYCDEYDALTSYKTKLDQIESIGKAIKEKVKELDALVTEKYAELTIEEIKEFLFFKKWMPTIQSRICDVVNSEVHTLSSQLLLIARRYEHTLSEIEVRVDSSRAAALSALERMGYAW